MNVTEILSAIDAEIRKLQEARSLLSGFADPIKLGPGRPKKYDGSQPVKTRKPVLSPEARAKIGIAQKKRWAAQKAAQKA